jgi:phospholipid-binding lipoprotein MlaA
MKRILILVLLLVLPAAQQSACAADRVPLGKSIDLLNDELKSDETTPQHAVSDPLEPMNRVFFEVNDKIYFWVLKPIKTGYSAVLPEDIRQCFGNFFSNISSPVSLMNNLLQGRIEDAWVVLQRFCINSTLGVYGFGDAATTGFNITPRPADFGQTLGVYGFGEGIYFFWPVVGPSSVRDSVGDITDTIVHPTNYMRWEMSERVAYYMGSKINAMSLAPEVLEDLKKFTLDPYVSARQAYFERRQNQIEQHKR